jgi:ribosomal protein L36
MKVRASVKKICDKCKIIKRKGIGSFVRTQNINKDRGKPCHE